MLKEPPTWRSVAPLRGLLGDCIPRGRNLLFYGIQIETRAFLHRRKFDCRHRQLLDDILDKHEAPELVLVPFPVLQRTVLGEIFRKARSLERVETKIDDSRHLRLDLVAEPATGLVDKAVLVVADTNGAEVAFAEIPDFVTFGWPLAGDHVQLVIAVQMTLEGGVTDLFALLQFLGNVRIAGGGKEGRKPVEPGDDAVLDLASRHLAGPADHRWRAEAAFEDRPLALRERRLPAVRPGKDLGAVVGGEQHDGVVVDSNIPKFVHHDADVVVELRHAGFMNAPAVL